MAKANRIGQSAIVRNIQKIKWGLISISICWFLSTLIYTACFKKLLWKTGINNFPKVRPKKKVFVCPFPTDPKYQKTKVVFFFYILNFVFLNKNVQNKVSEYIVTVPKRYFHQIYWNTTPSNTRIKPILRLCMPKNSHTWIINCISFASGLKKKKSF